MGSEVPVVTENEEVSTVSGRDRRLIAAGVLSVIAMLVVCAVVFVARELRPLADDYCLAMWAGEGVPAGIETVYRTWSGDVVIAASNLLFVGWPLIHLPWSLASVLPFLLAAVTVGIAAWALLVSAGAFRVGKSTALLVIPVVMIMWWAYWWIPVRHPDPVVAFDGVWDLELAGSVTAWQNINAAYVIPTSLWAIICVVLWSRVDRPLGPGVVLWAVVGVAMGFSGPVLALSFVAAVAVVAAVRLVRRSLRGAAALRYGLLVVGALGGVVASQLSPGTTARSTLLTDSPYSAMSGPIELLVKAVQAGARGWSGMLIGWSSLFLVLAAALLAVLLGVHNRSAARRLSLTGVGLLALSFCLHVASSAAEAFAYWGYWHLIVPTLVMFWALLCLGWAAACAVAGRTAVSWTLGITGGVALLAAGAVALGDMSTAIEDRYDRWARGSAPFGQIYDTSTDYVGKCAQKLGQLRELPPRG